MPTLTEAEKKFVKTLKVTDKKRLEDMKLVEMHVVSINAPAYLIEEVGDRCLMKIKSSGDCAWYMKSDLEAVN